MSASMVNAPNACAVPAKPFGQTRQMALLSATQSPANGSPRPTVFMFPKPRFYGYFFLATQSISGLTNQSTEVDKAFFDLLQE